MDVFFICEQYLAAKSKKCRQNTLDGYISAIRCHVLPKWGGRELADIRRKEVQEWVDSIPTAGAATKALKMLQQVFRWAIKQFELEIFDPTQGVELPARPIYRREVMTAKEIAYMLREAVGKPWEANIILAVALGLRPPRRSAWIGRTSTGAADGSISSAGATRCNLVRPSNTPARRACPTATSSFLAGRSCGCARFAGSAAVAACAGTSRRGRCTRSTSASSSPSGWDAAPSRACATAGQRSPSRRARRSRTCPWRWATRARRW